jgi:hypothetical protein
MAHRFRWVALAALLLLVPTVASAYPISPVPLWTLTEEAELIVVAKVVRIQPLPVDDEDWNSAAALLTVQETLKGPPLFHLKVPYPAGLLCPAPPLYLKGELVVAFLEREGDEWSTVGLSYGTLYPQGDELDDTKRMVRAALLVQQSPLPTEELEESKLRWSVEAAALPGTRWHGLYELAPFTDRQHFAYDRTGRPAAVCLPLEHRELLARAFVEASKVDPTMTMMLELLCGLDDPRVDRAALGALEGLLALETPPRWAQDLMWAVLARQGDTRLQERLKETGTESWEVTPERLRELWSAAKRELGIHDVPASEIDLERYLPVGARTPS